MTFGAYERSGRTTHAAPADVGAGLPTAAIAQCEDLRLQHIQRRAKDPATLRSKLEKAGALGVPDIETIAKNLAGVRVVLYTHTDVPWSLSLGDHS